MAPNAFGTSSYGGREQGTRLQHLSTPIASQTFGKPTTFLKGCCHRLLVQQPTAAGQVQLVQQPPTTWQLLVAGEIARGQVGPFYLFPWCTIVPYSSLQLDQRCVERLTFVKVDTVLAIIWSLDAGSVQLNTPSFAQLSCSFIWSACAASSRGLSTTRS